MPFTKDGLELIIDLSTGASYAPGYKALARICSVGLENPVDASRVRRHVLSLSKGLSNALILEAKVQTAGGLQGVSLIPESLMAKTIRKFNERLSEKIDEAGMRVFAHRLAGYEVSSTATKPSKTFELDWNRLACSIEMSVASAVKRELSNITEKVYRDYGQASLIASRIETPRYTSQTQAPSITKEEQLTQALVELFEIRDRWCDELGIISITNGDRAFCEAAKNGKVPEIDRLLPALKWGTTNGISRGSLMRHRRKLANNGEIRNLSRPKTKIIASHPKLEAWVRAQRAAFPQETVVGLHRRMQLQHADISVSITTLNRWLEAEGLD